MADGGTAAQLVIDPVTGLVWQRDLAQADGGVGSTWSEARQLCEGLQLGGRDDWRLPSRAELVSIVDLSRANPAQNLSTFPGASSDWFWTASPGAVVADSAWYVYFYFGYVNYADVAGLFRVRCVRGPLMTAAMETRFQVQGGTVQDVTTGRRWQREVPEGTFTLDEADAYCAALTVDMLVGWRLPTMPELEKIVDDSRWRPAIDTAVFADTPSAPFWTSSRWAGTPSLAWYVNLEDGSSRYDRVSSPGHVRCVR